MAEPSPSPNGDATGVERVENDLFKISLTEQNKANLFADALDRLACTHEEAEITLHNLQAWAPNVAKSFSQRTSSTIIQTPFRVICSKHPVENPIGTATEPTPQGTHPFDASFTIRQYLAISYSWHNSQWPATPHSAPAPGSIWPVGKRFAEAIVSERGHVREGIWMDQICINQENNSEKQLAIACMDVIYRTCRKLVVLLEDVELTEDEADLCRKYEAFAYKLDHRPQDTTEATLLISLHDKVAAARWWQRSWCFHEFVVGEPWSDKRHQTVHNTVFVIGLGKTKTLRVEWSTLHSILATVTLQLGHRNEHSQYLNPILAGFSNRTSPLMESRHPRAGALISSFMARFNAVCQTACTMPGDRQSVCINLIGIGLAYFRQHEPTEDEVYHLAVLLSLAAGEKVVLSFVNSEPLKVSGKLSRMNRSIAAADTTLDKFALGNIKGIHKVSADRLELDMMFFTGSFTGCSEEEINATYRIFPGAIKSTLPPLKTEAMRMPAFHGQFDSEFWSKLVLQLSHSEPSIRHAVSAISLIYRDVESSLQHPAGFVNANPEARKEWSFAIKSLSARIETHPNSTLVPLVCCLLFTCIEFLRGNAESSMIHIHSGFSILAPLRPNGEGSQDSTSGFLAQDLNDIEDYIVPMFSRLSVLCCLAGRVTPAIYAHSDEAESPHKDLDSARRRLFDISDTCIRFIRATGPKADAFQIGVEDLIEQAKLQTRLDAWHQRLEDLLQRMKTTGKPVNQNAVNILLVNYKAIYIWTGVCTTSQETATDSYRADLEELIHYAEQVIKPKKEMGSPQLLSFDVQLLGPLFYAALKCRHAAVRRRALELLRLAPRREGLWNAHHAYLTAKRVIELEEEHLDRHGLPDETSRLHGLPLPDDESRIYNVCELPFDFRKFDQSIVPSPTYPGTLEAMFQTKPWGLLGEFQTITEYIKL
ncbi:unnamed protein product [Colletotrichum noveboracense]|uniref:Heterokaryon incompatibility domain-containing protein n=1 Tax=Colletotrichum noveboracense TaxID=2664923 RepID=A0A9W4RPM9_9PEZI|nr:unnamed protein product [Colletotrichum noveboracense]